MRADDVRVNGAATPDEVAAVLAALQARQRDDVSEDRYERWRRERITVLRDNR